MKRQDQSSTLDLNEAEREMKKKPGRWWLWSLLFFTFLWLPAAVAEEKPKLTILPFLIETEASCPVCKTVFKKGEVLPGAQNTLTRLLHQKVESKGMFRIITSEKVDEALLLRGITVFQEKPQFSSIELGRELRSDFVLLGFVFRFEERVGSSVGVERPASAGFDLHLFRLRDGVEVWRGRMDETQRPLSENVLKIGSFLRRKARWLTAEELASVGLDEALRQLPGITELEGK